MEFWGIEVKPGQTVKCEAGDESIVHLSQASLGEIKKEKGSEYVPIFVKFNDQKLVIGNLSADKCAQIQYDLIFEKEFELSHGSKNSSVFFVGYKRVNEIDSSSDDDLYIDEGANGIAYKNKFGKLIAEKASASKDDNVAAKRKANLEKPKKELVKADKKVEDKDSENDSKEDDDEDYEDEDDDNNDSEEDSDKDEQIIKSSGDGDGSEEDEDDSSEVESSGDGSEEDEDDSSEKETPRDKILLLQQIIESSGDGSEEDEDDSSEEETPQEKVEKKRKADSASKTPIPGKKTKLVTPVENLKAGGDGKKAYVHVATPYPAKQGGKPQPSSKFDRSLACRTCNRKSKHGNAAK
ncbi:histone deacetylase HDT1-like isoform X2 [Phalaenopsis equestris]|uniref:histone deacetylase HDT1-like isoform X2 n=1 Tax=Phalaenopsis equestris TaxID=78828 RepID=UPI0009E61562|nr:histone deacetylase HDT1-like isoform X2 [Phalaenopsis equestris]